MNSTSRASVARFLQRLVLTTSLAAISILQAADAPNATGTWKWTFTPPNGEPMQTSLKLKQEGEKLTGVYVGRNSESPIEEGKITKEGEVTFQVKRERNGNTMIAKHKGKLSGDSIKGTIESERDGQTRSREWEAKREGANAAPTPFAGKWIWTIPRDNGDDMVLNFDLKQDGEKLTGVNSYPNGPEVEIKEGKVKDNEVTFNVVREREGRTIVSKFKGKLEDGAIKGNVDSDWSGEMKTYDWVAKKAAK